MGIAVGRRPSSGDAATDDPTERICGLWGAEADVLAEALPDDEAETDTDEEVVASEASGDSEAEAMMMPLASPAIDLKTLALALGSAGGESVGTGIDVSMMMI